MQILQLLAEHANITPNRRAALLSTACSKGYTPLDYADQGSHTECMEYLKKFLQTSKEYSLPRVSVP